MTPGFQTCRAVLASDAVALACATASAQDNPIERMQQGDLVIFLRHALPDDTQVDTGRPNDKGGPAQPVGCGTRAGRGVGSGVPGALRLFRDGRLG